MAYLSLVRVLRDGTMTCGPTNVDVLALDAGRRREELTCHGPRVLGKSHDKHSSSCSEELDSAKVRKVR